MAPIRTLRMETTSETSPLDTPKKNKIKGAARGYEHMGIPYSIPKLAALFSCSTYQARRALESTNARTDQTGRMKEWGNGKPILALRCKAADGGWQWEVKQCKFVSRGKAYAVIEEV
ncbi:hypothetical protein LTR09_010364 [Extremus antarcticus]|uniref:Uncharacterized protein n=1 Tax=Extremus antarcticus TaxID=702011 RepID=A0AAJ0G526_9PEZI|nr:hypothetical protein LTR09_010364 [Extremus antarcticus]